jgi:hypothetical protein
MLPVKTFSFEFCSASVFTPTSIRTECLKDGREERQVHQDLVDGIMLFPIASADDDGRVVAATHTSNLASSADLLRTRNADIAWRERPSRPRSDASPLPSFHYLGLGFLKSLEPASSFFGNNPCRRRRMDCADGVGLSTSMQISMNSLHVVAQAQK